MGLYFSRVYDTGRSLRCHSRGCDVIKTSGQHPSSSSYIYMRRRQGLCPSRCYDTRRTPAFILQGFTTPGDGRIRSWRVHDQRRTLRYHPLGQYSSRCCKTRSKPFRHQTFVSIIYFNNLRFKLNMGLYFWRVYNTRRLPVYCPLRVCGTGTCVSIFEEEVKVEEIRHRVSETVLLSYQCTWRH